MKHERRRFIHKVDYVTSAGWIDGPDGRAKLGLNPDVGPRAVVTELGIMKFGEDKRMYLAEFFPGVTIENVQKNTDFDMDTSRAVASKPPEEEVLDILINKVDPMRLMI